MLHRLAARQVEQNEFDRFINSPVEDNDDMDTLDWWKLNYKMFPHLARMACDVFAVPATGAGVERQFSKSGRVATSARALLHPDTVCDIMMYKDYLSRIGKPLTPERHILEIYADSGNGEEKDEDPEDSAKMIEWEKEWWQKADARLNI
jgi:hAT family C-terminal dimerisation region